MFGCGIALPPPGGRYRVLLLGDSFGNGLGLELLLFLSRRGGLAAGRLVPQNLLDLGYLLLRQNLILREERVLLLLVSLLALSQQRPDRSCHLFGRLLRLAFELRTAGFLVEPDGIDEIALVEKAFSSPRNRILRPIIKRRDSEGTAIKRSTRLNATAPYAMTADPVNTHTWLPTSAATPTSSTPIMKTSPAVGFIFA